MVNWCVKKVIPLLHSFLACVSAMFIITVIVLIILNNSGMSRQNTEIETLWGSILVFQEDIMVISNNIERLQNNLTDDFNTTTVLNNTINDYYEFLDNYTCQQIERINNMTPPCNGTFFITGVDGVVVNSGVPANGITINGTTFKIRLDDQQTLIDFIMTVLSIIDMNLATLNVEAIKTINNVTVDPMQNIDFIGQCGVDINVTSSGIIIDTCRIQNNATSLVMQLNETYYQILNETDVINATLISVTQLITVLQSQIDALEPLIVKNINGITPSQPSGNIDIVAGDPYIRVTPSGAPAEVTIENLGVNSLNGVNLARGVSVIGGPGVTVSVVPPNNVEVTNTIADIFAPPCVVQAQASLFANYPFSTLTGASFAPWTPETKTFPSCPDIFSGTRIIQPEGLWTLTFTIEAVSGTIPIPATCTPICAMSLSYGIQNNSTLDVSWVADFYPSFTQFIFQIGTTTQISIVGQVLMNGYVVTPGFLYDPVAFFESRIGVAVIWGGVVTATATRIG